MKYLIKNGRVIDPANKIDDVLDILVADGKIDQLGKNLNARDVEAIDAAGKIVVPGLVDMHSHLREPGREDEETVASGSRSAVRGGITGSRGRATRGRGSCSVAVPHSAGNSASSTSRPSRWKSTSSR